MRTTRLTALLVLLVLHTAEVEVASAADPECPFAYQRPPLEEIRKQPSGEKRPPLCRVDFSGTNLRGARFEWANLSRANLSGADLREANLSGADLSEANLSEANLRMAHLSGANLSDANLDRADLGGARL